eukprot:111489_1
MMSATTTEDEKEDESRETKCWQIDYSQDENVYNISLICVINDLILKDNNVISCKHLPSQYCWAVWVENKLKGFATSLGSWKILNSTHKNEIISTNYLYAILQLLKAKQFNSTCFNDTSLNITFLSGNIWILKIYMHQIERLLNQKTIPKTVYDLIFLFCKEITAIYSVDIWNNIQSINSSSFSLKCIKRPIQSSTIIERKQNNWHFIHFRYDNVDYKVHGRNYMMLSNEWFTESQKNSIKTELIKQYEASYQGTQEYNFPLCWYRRNLDEYSIYGKLALEKTFNLAQISILYAVKCKNERYSNSTTWKKHTNTDDEKDIELYPDTHLQDPYVFNVIFRDDKNIEIRQLESYSWHYDTSTGSQVERCIKTECVSETYCKSIPKYIGYLKIKICNKELEMYWEFKDENMHRKCFKYQQYEPDAHIIGKLLNDWR